MENIDKEEGNHKRRKKNTTEKRVTKKGRGRKLKNFKAGSSCYTGR